jgi:hypothetical protein
MNIPGYDAWKLMGPEDESPELPEIPGYVLEAKLAEWMQDPPQWLLEKAEEACLEDWKNGRKGW